MTPFDLRFLHGNGTRFPQQKPIRRFRHVRTLTLA